jgi:hypothetical protein
VVEIPAVWPTRSGWPCCFYKATANPTATLASYVEDAIWEQLQRRLHVGPDFRPATSHSRPVSGSMG